MKLRTPLRTLATLLLLSNASRAMVPEADHPGTEVTSYDASVRSAAALTPAPTDLGLRPGSNAVIVFLDHEGDSFVWLDARDLLTGGAMDLAIDPELLEALQTPTAWDHFAIPLQENVLDASQIDATGSAGQAFSNPFALVGYEDR
jgi:hypothetical protein